MATHLDHFTVPCRDRIASARRLAGLLGVAWAETGVGPFSPVYVNDGLTLDFDETAESYPILHFCFRVEPQEFDAILGRIRAAGIAYRSAVRGPVDMQVDTQHGGKIAYWNEPDGHQWEMLTVSYAREAHAGAAAPVVLVEFDAARTDELVAMWRASFEAGVGIVDPHPIQEQRDYLMRDLLPSNTVRMALAGDRLVGFVAMTQESISQLYVHVEERRRGIGTQLMAWAKAQSSGRLWLFAFARNEGARAFYERHGFRIVARGFEPNWRLDDLKYEWVGPDR